MPADSPACSMRPTSQCRASISIGDKAGRTTPVPVAPNRLDGLTTDQSGSTGDRDLHHWPPCLGVRLPGQALLYDLDRGR